MEKEILHLKYYEYLPLYRITSLVKLESFKEKIDEYTKTIGELQLAVKHYKTLYEQIISSVEPHLREEIGLKNNLLDFKSHIGNSISIKNIQEHFPKDSIVLKIVSKKKSNQNKLIYSFFLVLFNSKLS